MKLEQIVVGVDGSNNACRAVEWAAGLASVTGARVVAVHALGLLFHGEGGDVRPAQPMRAEIQRKLQEEWCAPLAAAGVTYESRVVDGSPVMVVLGAADDADADLIVLGSRGVGGFPELLLGSTSTQVAQLAHRPVTIIPTD
ncbi:MAG TPA: universal stress protein [Acidimicrobiales bacterium]|nr:universal stress protein [Acidimicrobiales bacterium]